MFPYLVLLIFDFFPAQLVMLPYLLDSNVTQLLANLLTKPSVFYYFANCIVYLVSIKGTVWPEIIFLYYTVYRKMI